MLLLVGLSKDGGTCVGRFAPKDGRSRTKRAQTPRGLLLIRGLSQRLSEQSTLCWRRGRIGICIILAEKTTTKRRRYSNVNMI